MSVPTTPAAPVAAKQPVAPAPAAAAAPTPPSVAPAPPVVAAKVVIPKFRTIGTGTVTTGGIKFTKDAVEVSDKELAAKLRKLKTMFVEEAE